ncbi:glyoxylate/hydroxypyruvate reductase A [Rhodovulum imhoffii]|uniref:Glyoxylate/hydroxypyruvate reductase A n=1 Tax=Rhodovulum imhoffii TaxID=365340 RepID=A0A2T5BWC3_9RHOB|nr:glyoxylate/hydroxypyruvate reductase A [Rhodovulum imhoffii]MBK5935116.1 glyoxylate/hydroxypyruvate reductase A [Rhodovulum imhoffii]PTN03919.1 glyoxylate/hydroxypyruvate reductase A [Rhodovulum imhoffii]
MNVLFAAPATSWETYRAPLFRAFDQAGLQATLHTDPDAAPETVDYIVYAPAGPVSDFTPFSRCKAVLSLWAGVETIVLNPTLTQPLCRMVDSGLQEGMVEWVTGHVLRHHLSMDRHIVNPLHNWDPAVPPLARDRKVTVLGLGELGRACAQALRALNFAVAGWARTHHSLEGIPCLHGADGLRPALARAEIAVLLLPLTAETENLLNHERLGWMPEGAVLINPGRGALVDDEALLAALGRGGLSHATLDVFRTEPLPAAHPFWAHPQVTVTPHIASATRPETAAQVIVENIRRSEAGEALLFRVDRAQGY